MNDMTKVKGNRSPNPTGRVKPMSGKGSIRKKPSRYGCGGKIKK